jgi:hypothetical protein
VTRTPPGTPRRTPDPAALSSAAPGGALRPARLRPAALRPATLRPAALRPAALRSAALVSAALVGVALLAGCSRAVTDTTAGGPIPHQLDGETYPGDRTGTTGTYLLQADGCMLLTMSGVSRLAIWPRGAAQDPEDARIVLLADGTRVRPGDVVTASAAVMPVTALAGMPGGYWGSRIDFCVPRATDVVVLDSVRVTAPAPRASS